MQKQVELCRGRARTVHSTESLNLLALEFHNDTLTGNGARTKQFDRRSMVDNKFNYSIMSKLAEASIPTQAECLFSDTECLVRKLDMMSIECVVHNRAIDSLVKHLGIGEGIKLNLPLFDLFPKDDTMYDPMISESHRGAFDWMSKENLARTKELTYKVNDVLKKLFDDTGLIPVDFRLEFGLYKGKVALGDEFFPDGSRLWDKGTPKKMDKGRFQQNPDGLTETYEAVTRHLGVQLD